MKSNVLKFGSRLLWGRLTGKRYPFLVQFSVTNRCNSRCDYCYAKYYDRASDDMPFHQVKTVIDDLVRAGMFRLNIVGGEPLVREDIGAIVEYVRQKGIDCAMTTNGILVPQKIDILKKLNTGCFSIDGQRRGHDLNRGAGTFDKAIAGLDACKMAGVRVQLSAVLTKHTVHDVDFMVALAEKYNCKVSFTTLIRQQRGNYKEQSDLFPANQDVKDALKRILELKKERKPILFSTEIYRYTLNWPDYTQDIIIGKKPDFKFVHCYAGKYFCIVDYNGDLYPCPQLVGIFSPGNILRDGFFVALKKTSQHNCRACSMPCSNEFSMFFALKPKVLLEEFLNWRKQCH